MLVIRSNGNPASTRILTLLEDRGGTLWCGTEGGLYAIDAQTGNIIPKKAK